MTRFQLTLVLIVLAIFMVAPAIASAQDVEPVPAAIEDNPILVLAVALAGFAELFKPWLKRFGMKEDTWTYSGAVWLIVAIAGVISAAVFKINLLPDSLGLPLVVGYVASGLVASFGSEIAHRVLDFIRAMTLFAENKASAA